MSKSHFFGTDTDLGSQAHTKQWVAGCACIAALAREESMTSIHLESLAAEERKGELESGEGCLHCLPISFPRSIYGEIKV